MQLGNHELLNLQGDFDEAVDQPFSKHSAQQGFGSTSARALSLAPTADIGMAALLPVIHRWNARYSFMLD